MAGPRFLDNRGDEAMGSARSHLEISMVWQPIVQSLIDNGHASGT